MDDADAAAAAVLLEELLEGIRDGELEASPGVAGALVGALAAVEGLRNTTV